MSWKRNLQEIEDYLFGEDQIVPKRARLLNEDRFPGFPFDQDDSKLADTNPISGRVFANEAIHEPYVLGKN